MRAMPRRDRKAPTPRLSSDVVSHQNSHRQERLLPEIDGPKLGPFRRSNFRSFSDFTLETLLSRSSSSGGAEGHVFRATLGDDTFAIKLFNPYDMHRDRFRFFPIENALMTDEEFIGNLDPFLAECRAYGRIEEIYRKQRSKGAEEKLLAAPCYGYTFLSQANVDLIARMFLSCSIPRAEEYRALIKQYVPEPSLDLKKHSVKRMLGALKTMNMHGLFPIDVREENYRSGLLVDFGQALTEPSCVLRVVDEDIAEGERLRGLMEFDQMMKKAAVKTQVRAYADGKWATETRAKVRARGHGEFVMLKGGDGKRAKSVVVQRGKGSARDFLLSPGTS